MALWPFAPGAPRNRAMTLPQIRNVGKYPRPAAQTEWRAKYGSAARELKGLVERFKKRFPESRFVAEAELVLAHIQGR